MTNRQKDSKGHNYYLYTHQRLSRQDVVAADFNETIQNLKEQVQERVTGKKVPEGVSPGLKSKAQDLVNMRAAADGLVRYGSATVPGWTDPTKASLVGTVLKAKHLEEVRQVVDDALNQARCATACTSACGRSCEGACSTDCNKTCSTCKGDCGGNCGNGCFMDCSSQCNDGCLGSCGKSCGGTCATACVSGCTGSSSKGS